MEVQYTYKGWCWRNQVWREEERQKYKTSTTPNKFFHPGGSSCKKKTGRIRETRQKGNRQNTGLENTNYSNMGNKQRTGETFYTGGTKASLNTQRTRHRWTKWVKSKTRTRSKTDSTVDNKTGLTFNSKYESLYSLCFVRGETFTL